MEEILKVGIPAVIGGVTAAVVAPWMNWRIEKKKGLLASRREFIKECRSAANLAETNADLIRKPIYVQLREYLSPSTISKLESHTTHISIIGSATRIAGIPEVLADVAKLEREWELL